MKIGITAEGPNLDAELGRRFGQSGYLLIVDSETLSIEVIHNEAEGKVRHHGLQMVVLYLF